MKTTILELETYDDFVSARERITWSREARILIVFPPRGCLMRSPVDFVLLKRASQAHGAQLGVVVQDSKLREYAKDANIPVFSDVYQAQRSVWRRQRRPRRWPKRVLPGTSEIYSLREQARAARLPEVQAWPLRVLFLSLGLLAVLALGFVFIPGARIQLQLKQQEQSVEMSVRASPQISAANLLGGIPAKKISVNVEGQDTLQATGFELVADKAAEGQVEFTNLTGDVVDVPVGTVVIKPGNEPQRFVTEYSVRVPAGVGEKINSSVQAVKPGSQGNVDENTISAVEGAVGLKVTVKNPAALKGGTDRNALTPSEADVKQLRERLLKTLAQSAENDMRLKAGGEINLIKNSIQMVKVVQEQQDPPAGSAAEQVRLTLRVEYSGLYYQQADLEQAARMALDAGSPSGFQAIGKSLQIKSLGEPEFSEGQAVWQIHASQKIRPAWEREVLVQAVLGQDLKSASQTLQKMAALEHPPAIQMAPAWWPRLPLIPFRIVLEVN
jgi:hypothetical protein